jgi:hypothetical protein
MQQVDAESQVGRLMLQFLAWVALRRRSYAETMDAWRTSCPRLSVWEDAVADGLVEVDDAGAQGCRVVRLTAAGFAVLRAAGAAQADSVV